MPRYFSVELLKSAHFCSYLLHGRAVTAKLITASCAYSAGYSKIRDGHRGQFPHPALREITQAYL